MEKGEGEVVVGGEEMVDGEGGEPGKRADSAENETDVAIEKAC